MSVALVRPFNSPARWIFVAALLAFVPFVLVESWINLYNKHMLAILPFVAIGTGVAFSALYRFGWVGRGLTWASLGYLAYAGIGVWFNRVYFYVLPPGSGVEKTFGG